MKVVIQRVSKAFIECESGHTDEIQKGLLILLGIEETDGQDDISWLGPKICQLRIFPDENEVMNKNVVEAGGDLMVVSQFTLHASTKKGNRPSYIRAARPEHAIPLYESFIAKLEALTTKKVRHGVFGDHMDISLTNDGPVTIIIDSKNKE